MFFFQDEKNNAKYPNNSDFSFPLNAEKMKPLMDANQHLYNVSLPDTYYRFFEVGVGYFFTQGGKKDYATSYDFEKYSDLFGGAVDPTLIKNGSKLQGNAVFVVCSCQWFFDQ